MKLRTSLVTAGVAVALGTTGALALPAVASAHSASTTLTFTSVTKNQMGFSISTGANQDTDVNAGGQAIGFDMLYFACCVARNLTVNATFAISGGFLYGTAIQSGSTGAITNGKVTGGTGAFAGATGKLTIKALNKTNTKYAITITYSG